MPTTAKGGTNRAGRTGSAAGTRRDVPPAILVVVAVVVVVAIGAGVFYVVNGGWQTQSQKEWQFQHEAAPLFAAEKGRPELLQEENARRKAAGEPQLQVRERHQRAGDMRQKLQEMQSRMGGGQGGAAAP